MAYLYMLLSFVRFYIILVA